MSPNGDVIFSPAEETQFDGDLELADAIVKELAKKYRCKFLATAGRGWPGRSVQKRVVFRTFIFRVRLHPQYLQDHRVFYETVAQWSLQYGELLTRLISDEVVDSFTRDEMRDQARLRRSFTDTLDANLRR
jgi:hypothetical protein